MGIIQCIYFSHMTAALPRWRISLMTAMSLYLLLQIISKFIYFNNLLIRIIIIYIIYVQYGSEKRLFDLTWR